MRPPFVILVPLFCGIVLGAFGMMALYNSRLETQVFPAMRNWSEAAWEDGMAERDFPAEAQEHNKHFSVMAIENSARFHLGWLIWKKLNY